ncbi:dienelactone hydrolase family protein [Actinopolymorpha sp. B11F2]|uniref:dienelactone hydrolase family protein n=1 Tax=Actinopolymorpha sp. B11F2 TaxID=3160862 RepID=UPI0032E3B026
MSVPVTVPAGTAPADVELRGDLVLPTSAEALVLFAHGSGSSRHSPRNRAVARTLSDAGFATVLLDLLTPDEEVRDRQTAELRFDIGLLGKRVTAAVDQLRRWEETRSLPIGIFGASTGAASALVAAAERPDDVGAIVSRGGRPDLAGVALDRVRAPTLLIVGSEDRQVLGLNQQAARRLSAPHDIAVVAGATHLFEEPGALERVAQLASEWFSRYLRPDVPA